MSDKVTIEYKTMQTYCHCCEQLLPNPQTSVTREFNLSKENILQWTEYWKEIAEASEDELEDVISELVYETIRFFAVSSYDKVIIESGEFDKVKKFILKEVIA
jgi:hypothetical protein